MKRLDPDLVKEKLLNQEERFRAIFRHDFLNYLNGIIGFSKLSVSELSMMEMDSLRSYLNIIIEQAESAKSLVSIFESLSSPCCSDAFKEVRLSLCFEKLLNLHQEVAKRKCIKLSHCLDEEIFIDPVNEMSLCFILNNFLTNSLKFTGQGGFVVLRSSRLSNGKVEIRVEDNGLGMSKSRLSKLFSSVVSAEGTDSEKGLGIGLKLCKKIADESGIRLSIESEEGVGTVAKILLNHIITSH